MRAAVEFACHSSDPVLLADSSSNRRTPIAPVIAAARASGLPAFVAFKPVVEADLQSSKQKRVYFSSRCALESKPRPSMTVLNEVTQACEPETMYMDRRSLRASNWERAHAHSIASGHVEVMIHGPGVASGRSAGSRLDSSTSSTSQTASKEAVPDATTRAYGVAGGAVSAVLAGTSPDYHDMIQGVHSSYPRAEFNSVTAGSMSSVVASAAAAAIAASFSVAGSGSSKDAKAGVAPPTVASDASSDDSSTGGTFNVGVLDGNPAKWADAWLTVLPDCLLLWAYVSTKQDVAAKAAIAAARSTGLRTDIDATPAMAGTREHAMNLLSGSKVDGAAGMRLAARIPLCEESAIHAVGAREWQAFSVSKSQQRSTTDLWTFRAATPAEMLWWISILPARDVVATDNSLLVMPDAVMGADAMLATARRALQLKNHRTFWAALHAHEVRQRLWTALSHFDGAHHLLLAWLHIRGFELAHPLTRRLSPSLLECGLTEQNASSWCDPLPKSDAQNNDSETMLPRRELLKVIDYSDLLEEEDIVCATAHAHAIFKRFFHIQRDLDNGISPPANPGSGPSVERQVPHDSATVVLSCVPPTIVDNVSAAVGWGVLSPCRGSELLFFPAPDAFTPLRIAIEIAIYARVLLPYSSSLINTYCASSVTVGSGAGIVSDDAGVHRLGAGEPSQGRLSATNVRGRGFLGSMFSAGVSGDDDPFGVQAMRRAQHSRSLSQWSKQRHNTAAESRVRNQSAAPSSISRGNINRPQAAPATAPQSSRWASVSLSQVAPKASTAPRLPPPAAHTKRLVPPAPPPSPHLGATASTLPDLPPALNSAAPFSMPAGSSAPFVTSSFVLGARTGFGVANSHSFASSAPDAGGRGNRLNQNGVQGVRSTHTSIASRFVSSHPRAQGTFAAEQSALDSQNTMLGAGSRMSAASMAAFDLEAALRDNGSFNARDVQLSGPITSPLSWTAEAAARLLLPCLPPRTSLGGLTADADALGGGGAYSSTAARLLLQCWLASASDELLNVPVRVCSDLVGITAAPVGEQTSSATLVDKTAQRVQVGLVAAMVEKFSSASANALPVLGTGNDGERSLSAKSRANWAPPDELQRELPRSSQTLKQASFSGREFDLQPKFTTARLSDCSFRGSFSLNAPQVSLSSQSSLCFVDWSSRPLGIHLTLDPSMLPALTWIEKWRQKWDHHRGLRRSFASTAALSSGSSLEIETDTTATRVSGTARHKSRQAVVSTCCLTPHEQDQSGRHLMPGGMDVSAKTLVLFMHRLKVPNSDIAPFNNSMLLSTMPAHVLAQLPSTPDGSPIMSTGIAPRYPRRFTRDVASTRSDAGSGSFGSAHTDAIPGSEPTLVLGASSAVNSVRVRPAPPGSWASIWLRDTSMFGRRRSSDASGSVDPILHQADSADRSKSKRQSIVMSAATAGALREITFTRDSEEASTCTRDMAGPRNHTGLGMEPILEETDRARDLEVTYALQDAAAHTLLVTAELAKCDSIDRQAILAVRSEIENTLYGRSDPKAQINPPPPPLPRPYPPPPKTIAAYRTDQPDAAQSENDAVALGTSTVFPTASTSLLNSSDPSLRIPRLNRSSGESSPSKKKFRAAFGFYPLPPLPVWVEGSVPFSTQGKHQPCATTNNRVCLRSKFSRSVARWADVAVRDLGLGIDDAYTISAYNARHDAHQLGLAIAIPPPAPSVVDAAPIPSGIGRREDAPIQLGPHLVIPPSLRPRIADFPGDTKVDLVLKLLRSLGLPTTAAVHCSQSLCSELRRIPGQFRLPSGREVLDGQRFDTTSNTSEPLRKEPTLGKDCDVDVHSQGRQQQPTTSVAGVSALSSLPELPSVLLWQGLVRVSWCHALAGHPAMFSLDPSAKISSRSDSSPAQHLLRALVASSLPSGVAGGVRRLILSAHFALTQVYADCQTRNPSLSASAHFESTVPLDPKAFQSKAHPTAPLGSVKFDMNYDNAFCDLVTELLWPSVKPLETLSECVASMDNVVSSSASRRGLAATKMMAQVFADGTLRFLPDSNDRALRVEPDSVERASVATARLLLPALLGTLEECSQRIAATADSPIHSVGGLWLPASLDVAPARDVHSPGHAVEIVLRAGFLTLVPCDARDSRRLLNALQQAASQPSASESICLLPDKACTAMPKFTDYPLFSQIFEALRVHGATANFSMSPFRHDVAAPGSTAVSSLPSACRTAAIASASFNSGPAVNLSPDRITPLAISTALSPGSEAAAASLRAAAAADTASAALSTGLAAGLVQQTSISFATANLQKRGRINRRFKPRVFQTLLSYRLPSSSVFMCSAFAQLLALQRRVLAAEYTRRYPHLQAAMTVQSSSAETPRLTRFSVVGSLFSTALRASRPQSAKLAANPAARALEAEKTPRKVTVASSPQSTAVSSTVVETNMPPSSAFVVGASPPPLLPLPRRSFFGSIPRGSSFSLGSPSNLRQEETSLSNKSPLAGPAITGPTSNVRSIPAQPLGDNTATTLHAWATLVATSLPLGYSDTYVFPTLALMLVNESVAPTPMLSMLLSDPGTSCVDGVASAGVTVARTAGESLPMCSRSLMRVRSRNVLRLAAIPSLQRLGAFSTFGRATSSIDNRRSAGTELEPHELLAPMHLLTALQAGPVALSLNPSSGADCFTQSILPTMLSRSPSVALLFASTCLVDSSGEFISAAYFKLKTSSGVRVPRGVIPLVLNGQYRHDGAIIRLPVPFSRAVASVVPGFAQVYLRIKQQQSPPLNLLPITNSSNAYDGPPASTVRTARSSSSGVSQYFKRHRSSETSAQEASLSVGSIVGADAPPPACAVDIVTADRTWEFLVPSAEAAVAAEIAMLIRTFGPCRLERWRHVLVQSSASIGPSVVQPGLASAIGALMTSSVTTTNPHLGGLLGCPIARGRTGSMIDESRLDVGQTDAQPRSDSSSSSFNTAGLFQSTFDDSHTAVQSFGIPAQRIVPDATQQWLTVSGSILGDYCASRKGTSGT